MSQNVRDPNVITTHLKSQADYADENEPEDSDDSVLLLLHYLDSSMLIPVYDDIDDTHYNRYQAICQRLI
jgi:hypothetical protein